MNIQELARKNVQILTPYQSARRVGGSGDVWLNANEFPRAPSYPLTQQTLNRYPEAQPQALLAAYARYAGVRDEQLMVSRGADEAIQLLMLAFCEPDQDFILYCPPTYGMYGVSAETLGVGCRVIRGKTDWQLDLPAIKAALDNVKLIYLCSPNNPTGNLLNQDDLRELLAITRDQALVIVDEAYIDFCPEHSVVHWLSTYPNLVILRTLSKAFALAGIRCGFTMAHPDIIQILLKVIAPYPMPTPTVDIALQALSEKNLETVKNNVNEIIDNRQWLVHVLPICDCVDQVFDSQANWLLVRFYDSSDVFRRLSEEGIVLRDQGRQPGLRNCLRITIGTLEECEKTVSALRAIPCTGSLP
ncbi:MAG: histidinol-phosphate transaminase [Burkholderiales bacterium]|jgi:histidinol-phosphate aminotransferase|nr:histidinol-phosphate transaminase [Burkholderiales bacterium]